MTTTHFGWEIMSLSQQIQPNPFGWTMCNALEQRRIYEIVILHLVEQDSRSNGENTIADMARTLECVVLSTLALFAQQANFLLQLRQRVRCVVQARIRHRLDRQNAHSVQQASTLRK